MVNQDLWTSWKGITQKWHVHLRDNSPWSLHGKETSVSLCSSVGLGLLCSSDSPDKKDVTEWFSRGPEEDLAFEVTTWNHHRPPVVVVVLSVVHSDKSRGSVVQYPWRASLHDWSRCWRALCNSSGWNTHGDHGWSVQKSGRGRSRACRLRTNNIELPLLPAAARIGSLPCLLVPGGREYNGIGLRDSHWKGGRGVVFCRPPSVRAGARPAVIYWIWKLDNLYVFLGRRSTANPCFLNAYVA